VNQKVMKWNVVYFDETYDALCHRCVRPFVAFEVGETIKYNGGNRESPATDARIIGIDVEKELYDIKLLEESEILRRVPAFMLHRSKTDKYVYKEGSHALIERGTRSFPVLILRVNRNETFTVGSSEGLTGNCNISELQPHMTWYEEYA